MMMITTGNLQLPRKTPLPPSCTISVETSTSTSQRSSSGVFTSPIMMIRKTCRHLNISLANYDVYSVEQSPPISLTSTVSDEVTTPEGTTSDSEQRISIANLVRTSTAVALDGKQNVYRHKSIATLDVLQIQRRRSKPRAQLWRQPWSSPLPTSCLRSKQRRSLCVTSISILTSPPKSRSLCRTKLVPSFSLSESSLHRQQLLHLGRHLRSTSALPKQWHLRHLQHDPAGLCLLMHPRRQRQPMRAGLSTLQARHLLERG